MHIANVTSASLDGTVEPVDLEQTPADVVVLSFSDSDLAAVSQAWQGDPDRFPDMRLAALRDLRHPMSVDLWVDRVAQHARVVLVRILGGYDWWSYGCDALAETARRHGISLVMLPGECRERDERLAALSTVDDATLDGLLACFREGGPRNMIALLARLAKLAGRPIEAPPVEPVARCGFYKPGQGPVALDEFLARTGTGAPVVPILFYRAMLLANDTAPIDSLASALSERGMVPVPVFVPTLKDPDVARFLHETAEALKPGAIIATTAFAASLGAGPDSVFAEIGVPVLQAIVATTRRDAWAEGDRGLGTADIAMHVVLPELDGRILAGALSFRPAPGSTPCNGVAERLEFDPQRNLPEPSRVQMIADRLDALFRLQRTPAADRRLTVILPDYPGAGGRTGYAVGLDVPASVLAILEDLKAAGYDVRDVPTEPRVLVAMLEMPKPALADGIWPAVFDALPDRAKQKVREAWGKASDGPFAFRHARFGKITVALAPDRGRAADRRSDYHDPSLPPRHELLAFGHWIRRTLDCHAIVHVGAHGTLEWLPGKAVALSSECFPEIVAGPLPVIYPFIVNNPGEAAQAKRRIGAVTLGHMPPPMIGAGLTPEQAGLERLVDEYVQADGLDFPRRDRLAKLILAKAAETGLDRIAGVARDADAGTALKRIDAWLCDLKDFAIKDGQHVFARLESGATDPLRIASAEAERAALLDALDGRYIAPGPSGSPMRGRTDVFPTGRNLYAIDPRTMPTPTAFEIGRAAADEILRYYAQENGDWPRALVIDLWASASLRTGGEEIAQGLALMGCRPQWDTETGRVTGIEVLPPAMLDHPRIDVTWRISGLFRDMFPAQIALMAAAVEAVAKRDEEEHQNPLAVAYRATGTLPRRVFGSAAGTYGSGAESALAAGDWESRDDIGAAYLAAASHAFAGAEGAPEAMPGAFAERVARSDLLVHAGDEPGRDLLEGSADVAFIGGFAAAAAALGVNADLVSLDTTDPARPRARSVVDAVTRVVHARAANPRYIAGQMRHGPRGASDFAETVDRLVAFAETTNAIPGRLIDAVHDAYVGDRRVRDFMLRENPAAALSVGERLTAARKRGLWHPLRNSVDDELAGLIAEAHGMVQAS